MGSLYQSSSDPAFDDVTIVESCKDDNAASVSEKEDREVAENCVSPSTSCDENTIWWDGDDDPENPYNWPAWRKVLNCVLVSSLAFITPLASSMFAPGVPELMEEFNSTSKTLAAFCVSVYVLGFAAGPMVFAPLSEIYGRVIVYHISNAGFIGELPHARSDLDTALRTWVELWSLRVREHSR
jgi:hypothetical protein